MSPFDGMKGRFTAKPRCLAGKFYALLKKMVQIKSSRSALDAE